LKHLDDACIDRLEQIAPITVPAGGVLFRAGDAAKGYPIVLGGTIDVYLTSISGREIVLYSVSSGQACIQSTLGLMGTVPYSAEARAVTETTLILVPALVFTNMLGTSDAFRKMVFSAFGERMNSVTHLLEKVAFLKIEPRIAEALIALSERQGSAKIAITQSELASRIGTAREVISRKLEHWGASGVLKTTRGAIEILDLKALKTIAEQV
ncbi:MAG: Crp/Fnr family transcriptional regulator, partial [Planktotalea sp.]|uniref:Crp/Fnr family transcriptional regulator n=1 Tax=Planktotalea sp. TaxID=2029877 RepID=UPI003C74E5C6